MFEKIKKLGAMRSEKAVRERCIRYAIKAGAQGSNAILVAKSIKTYIEEGKVALPGYGRYGLDTTGS